MQTTRIQEILASLVSNTRTHSSKHTHTLSSVLFVYLFVFETGSSVTSANFQFLTSSFSQVPGTIYHMQLLHSCLKKIKTWVYSNSQRECYSGRIFYPYVSFITRTRGGFNLALNLTSVLVLLDFCKSKYSKVTII